MPFSFAKRSHLVSGFGFGRGFSLGSRVVGGGKAVTGPAGEGVVGRAKRAARREAVEASVSWSRWGSRSAYAAGSVGEASNAARRGGSVAAGAAGGACWLPVYSWSTWETSMVCGWVGERQLPREIIIIMHRRVVIFGENT